ncbi:DUF3899 domain-containing protein [Brevibacillus ruminantium]|uniref:DUF3899 domain-containing protein n=1 Tax=Brevibacillus ruminantium TaxID=2950604 RepID=A0ABY4WHS6_9BACL|nr:DUF3899 domain-containing protein [Brevibacillus ruminantium]USG64181.1 DUF3899 domain-containing protein [Brevibacillus ruminantium]
MGKRLGYLLTTVLLLAIAARFLFSPSTLLLLINQSFLIGLFLTLIGSIALVLRSGFFTVFLKGFKQLKSMLFKRPRVMESDWFQEKDPVLAKKTETLLKICTSLSLWAGGTLLFLSIVLTCFYLYQS